MKVLYTFYHGSAFAWSVIHKLSAHAEDDAYLLIGEGWDWCAGNPQFRPIYRKFIKSGIFKGVFYYDNCLGRDKVKFDTLEKTEDAILSGLNKCLKEQKCDIASFDRIYSHTDGEDTFGIYLSLINKEFFWFENGPKILKLKNEQYVRDIYVEHKGYQAALLKYKTLFGGSDLQSYILYPNSDATGFPIERCEIFDAEKAAKDLPASKKKMILKNFNLESCQCPENGAMLLLQSSWLPSQTYEKNELLRKKYKNHILYMYSSIQCMLDYFMPKGAVPVLKTHPWQMIDEEISKRYFQGAFIFPPLFTVLLTKSLLSDYVPKYRVLLGSTSNQQIQANSNDVYCPGVWLFSVFYHKYYVALDVLSYINGLFLKSGDRFESIGHQGNYMGYNKNYLATDINNMIRVNFHDIDKSSSLKYVIIQMADETVKRKIEENDFVIITDVWETLALEKVRNMSEKYFVITIKISKMLSKQKEDVIYSLDDEYIYFVSKSDIWLKKFERYELTKENKYTGITLSVTANVENYGGKREVKWEKVNDRVIPQEKEIYVPKSERYKNEEFLAMLLKLSDYSAPLPVLFKEVYGKHRIVIYSTKDMVSIFKNVIHSFLFYKTEEIIFCADESFLFSDDENQIWFKKINQIHFLPEDVFFALDTECKIGVIDYVKSQVTNGVIETVRKPFVNALMHYVKSIRPLKFLLSKYPKLQVILTDNFSPPKEKLTEWEKNILENKLTQEKVIEELKKGNYPYCKCLYPDKYTVEDILMMHLIPKSEYDDKGVLKLDDYESEYVNIRDGIRKTVGQPKDYNRKIHIFGGCSIFGIGQPDEATFASCLQELLNSEATDEKIVVENRGSFVYGKFDAMWNLINNTSFGDNDIIIIPNNYRWASFYYSKVSNVHYVDMTVHSDEDGEIYNDMWHPSSNGMKVYARNIFDFLKSNRYLSEYVSVDADFVKIHRTKQYGIPEMARKE